MAEPCREFGISRKTGYKIFGRYQECGMEGLTDRSRRPYCYANQLPFQVENYILNVKREHASWGARKIRERLIPTIGIKGEEKDLWLDTVLRLLRHLPGIQLQGPVAACCAPLPLLQCDHFAGSEMVFEFPTRQIG
jgi:Homeodomain-like domain